MDLYTDYDGHCPNCDSDNVDFVVNNTVACRACGYRFLVNPDELEDPMPEGDDMVRYPEET